MSERPFALISDVHGNRWALEAVLEDLDRRGIRDGVDLGDCLFGPLDPAGTWHLLADLGWPTVRGNQDRAILDASEPYHPTLAFVLGEIGAEGVSWLGEVTRPTWRQGTLLACHGTPQRDDAYLLEVVGPHGADRRPADEIATDLDATDLDATDLDATDLDATDLAEPDNPVTLVACGHSHLPRRIQVGERLVVNPGSVGLPAYDDDAPFPHAMESGSPHAAYAVVTPREEDAGGGFLVEQIAVPYDHETAARAAERNQRPDWARWIRTGLAR